jgi:hypothetical protein
MFHLPVTVSSPDVRTVSAVGGTEGDDDGVPPEAHAAAVLIYQSIKHVVGC